MSVPRIIYSTFVLPFFYQTCLLFSLFLFFALWDQLKCMILFKFAKYVRGTDKVFSIYTSSKFPIIHSIYMICGIFLQSLETHAVAESMPSPQFIPSQIEIHMQNTIFISMRFNQEKQTKRSSTTNHFYSQMKIYSRTKRNALSIYK